MIDETKELIILEKEIKNKRRQTHLCLHPRNLCQVLSIINHMLIRASPV